MVIREEIKNIVNEINSEKPKPSKIKNSYEKIKSIAEGYETIESIGKFGAAAASVITMFI